MQKLLSLSLLITITACSSLVDKVEKDKLATVKKVAIVGFTMDRANPKDAASVLKRILKIGTDDKGMTVAVDLVHDEKADYAYSLVSKRLSERLNVSVLPQKEVMANKTIARLFAKKDEKIQMGVTPNYANYERLEAKGIPQPYYVRNEGPAVLQELCKELKVDAVMFVTTTAHTDSPGIWTLGIGRVGAESDLAVQMYQPEIKEYTLVLNQRGDTVKFGNITFFGGVEEKDQLVPKQYQSFESALDKLVGRL